MAPGVAVALPATVLVPTTISAAYTKPQSKDSYQPRLRADHSKMWTRIGDGSDRRAAIAGCVEVWGRSERKEERVEVVVETGREVAVASVIVRVVGGGRWGERALMRVRIVWRGSSGSQESIQNVVGVKSVAPGVRAGGE
jgi:hypothetical protein